MLSFYQPSIKQSGLIVLIMLGILLLTGLIFPPLMDNDAAEYAAIALRMHNDQDYANIINRDVDYLDKPHLLFWSAALGYKIFGVGHAGYRIFSVLICLLGAYSTYRLGKLLYDHNTGKLTAFIFITAQAIIIANHDVRTDSMLTGFIIFGIWNFAAFIKTDKLLHIVAGAAGIALGVGTKGMIAVLVSGSVIFFYILGLKKWDSFINPKWIIGLLTFLAVLTPFLVCYYYQFDLQPEKFINGQYGVSGIKFLLWDQSFERFAGERGFENNPEFFFFHHTFLWAFLPWSIIALLALYTRFREIVRAGWREIFMREQITLLGTLAMFTFMSFSSFKLPHYINVLFPLIAIGTAAYLDQVSHRTSIVRKLIITQLVVNIIILALILILNVWAFPVQQAWIILTGAAIFFVIIYIYMTKQGNDPLYKVWMPSCVVIILVNFLMNTNFYPALGSYQAGSTLAHETLKAGIPQHEIYVLRDRYRSFDFYSGEIHRKLTLEQIKEKQKERGNFFLLLGSDDIAQLDNENIPYQPVVKAPDYKITRLKGNFLNPAKREKILKYALVVEINGKGVASVR